MHQESAALKKGACVKLTDIYEVWDRISPWECVVLSCPSFHIRYLYFRRMFSLLRKLLKDKDISMLSFEDSHNEERKTCELVLYKTELFITENNFETEDELKIVSMYI